MYNVYVPFMNGCAAAASVYLLEGFVPMLGWKPAPGPQFGCVHDSPRWLPIWAQFINIKDQWGH